MLVRSPGVCFSHGFCFHFCDAFPLKFLVFARWPQKGHIASDPQKPMVFLCFFDVRVPAGRARRKATEAKKQPQINRETDTKNKKNARKHNVSRPRSRGLKKPPKMTSRSPPGRGGRGPKRPQEAPGSPQEGSGSAFWAPKKRRAHTTELSFDPPPS